MKVAARIAYSVLLILALIAPVAAQQPPSGHLVPIGGGYADVYAGFAQAAVANAKNDQTKILVLPSALASNAETITDAERAELLKAAEDRRFQIEEACKRAAPPKVTCTAILAPIFTRSDALAPTALKFFTDDLSAVFILDGNPVIAKQVVEATPVELALTTAYPAGTLIAGTGAGGLLQSWTQLADYPPNFSADNALDFGAAAVRTDPPQHGLPFAIKTSLIDPHFFQENRVGRLLNAIALPDAPHLGLGVDAYTGINIYGKTRVQDVFGLYTAAILDGVTYHAADAVRYGGSNHTLSLHNVLVQLLPPGQFSYDLEQRVMSIEAKAQPPKARIARDFKTLTLPKGAGPLILAGDLSDTLEHNPIIQRFVALAGGAQAKLMLVAAGYPSADAAQAVAEKYAAAADVPAQIFVASAQGEPLTIPPDISGLLLLADDQSKITVSLLEPIKAAWLNGLPVLADDGGAAVLGATFSAHGPTPSEPEGAEAAVEKSFLQGTTKIFDGLGLLDIAVEPQLLNDNRWGRLFSLAYNQPDRLAVGLTKNSALEITRSGAHTLGDNALITLDLRNAALAQGTNAGFAIANGLLDVFAPGEKVIPINADVNAAPSRAATPALPTITPTPLPTATPTVTPTPLPPTATSTPAATPTALPTQTPPPAALTEAESSAARGLPLVPLAIGAGIIFFAIVLIAGRRRP